MSNHSNMTLGDIHILQNWEVTSVALLNSISVVSADIGKEAKVLSDNSIWRLVDTTPTFKEVLTAGNTSIADVGTLSTGQIWYGSNNSVNSLNLGASNAILAVQSGGNLIYKTLVASTNVTITHSGATISIGAAGGGGAKPDLIIERPAGGWDYPATSVAALDTVTGSNGTWKGHLMSLGSMVQTAFSIPPDLNAASSVNFRIWGVASTASASTNIELTVETLGIGANENIDGAYTTIVSGDLATNGSQGSVDYVTFASSVASLGWASNDMVKLRLSYTAPSTAPLGGPWRMTNWRADIPRA